MASSAIQDNNTFSVLQHLTLLILHTDIFPMFTSADWTEVPKHHLYVKKKKKERKEKKRKKKEIKKHVFIACISRQSYSS